MLLNKTYFNILELSLILERLRPISSSMLGLVHNPSEDNLRTSQEQLRKMQHRSSGRNRTCGPAIQQPGWNRGMFRHISVAYRRRIFISTGVILHEILRCGVKDLHLY